MTPDKLLFAKTHEWLQLETDNQGKHVATVGVSAFALEALTDLVYIELPKIGRQLKAHEPFGEIESVKAVSDLYSPVDGVVIAVHDALANKLETLNADPYSTGWMVKIEVASAQPPADLLNYAAYQRQCAEEQH